MSTDKLTQVEASQLAPYSSDSVAIYDDFGNKERYLGIVDTLQTDLSAVFIIFKYFIRVKCDENIRNNKVWNAHMTPAENNRHTYYPLTISMDGVRAVESDTDRLCLILQRERIQFSKRPQDAEHINKAIFFNQH